ncbi:MAG: YggT family protein [Treponema sp.]|jgi:YggT family protein|nr:YggT family protein [Treponema sp.]
MIINIIAAVLGFYSILILIRIIFSWFGNMVSGRFADFLIFVTDPYLNWWRRNLNLKIGVMDFSAIAAITALSVAQNVLYTISRFDKITLGNVLAIILVSVWSVLSFIIGFYVFVILLRLIAYLTNRDIYSPFWQLVDSVSKPVIYKFNRLFFGDKINYDHIGVIISIVLLIVIWIAGGIIIPLLANMFSGFPL